MNASSAQGSRVGPPASLRENIASLSGLQIINYVAPLITVPYLVRVLGASEFGLLSFAQSVAAYFSLITDYGFSLSATRAVAARRTNAQELARTFWLIVLARVALLAVSGALLASLVLAVPRLRQAPALYAACFLNVVGSVVLPVWFFQGIERMRLCALAQSVFRLLTIPTLIFFVNDTTDTVRAAAIQGSVPLLAGLLLLPLLYSWVGLPRRPLVLIAQIPTVLRNGWDLFLAHTAAVIQPATTVVVLGAVSGNLQVGYYSAADKVIRAVTAGIGPIAQSVYPRLNRLKTDSTDSTLHLMRRSLVWIPGLAALASVATFLLAAPVGRLLWGTGFEPSVATLRCLSPLPFLLASVNVLGPQTMLVFEMDRVFRRALFGCVLAGIPLTAAFSFYLGAMGAAMAVVAISAWMAVRLALSLRNHRRALPAEWMKAAEAGETS